MEGEFKVVVPKIGSWENKLICDLKSCLIQEKTLCFYEKNLKLTKNHTFNNALIGIFFTVDFYQFLKNYWIFLNHGLFFGQTILCNCTFSDFKSKVFSG